VFHEAWGLANIQPQRQTAPVGGFVAPQLSGQDTDVYFFGETVEKLGPKKYKITNGGFTTCVQPSPRWNLDAGEVVLNIDSYTLLKNAVFNVKDVPLFYLPILYYPTRKKAGRQASCCRPTAGRASEVNSSAMPFSGRSTAARTPRSNTTGTRKATRASTPSIASSR
jgi:hypothetical protein